MNDLGPLDKPRYSEKELQTAIFAAVVKATGTMNGVPVHVHNCPDGHEWFCPSPYCEDVAATPRPCVSHAGTAPIMKGAEPWRGGTRA